MTERHGTLITGGAGFVGLALAEAILGSGRDVVLFDARQPPDMFLAAVASLEGRLRVVIDDILDAEALRRAFSAAPISHVFHGAAITADAERERRGLDRILEVNLLGTVRALEAARDAGVARVVYPSSLVVYGESLYDREVAREDEAPAIPDTTYAITKYAGERLALRFGALHGLDVVCGRIGSVFGPWEQDSGLRDTLSPFWHAAEQARAGREVVLPSRDLPRELIYARDLAAALDLLLNAERPSFPVYNLAVAADWTSALTEWCGRLGATWRVAEAGEKPTVAYDLRRRARQDTSRLIEDLGFSPRFLPTAALADYQDWLARQS